MARHISLGLCWAALFALWAPARGGERSLAETIRAAADAVRPAVVTIEVKGRRGQPGQPDFPNLPFIVPPGQGERRFEFQWPPREGGQPNFPFGEVMPFIQGRRGPAEGSGLLLEAEGDRGLVAAPQALLAGAEEIFVKLSDGRQLAAKLLGTDRVTGVGALEVRGPKLTAAKLGDPAALGVGDPVIAVGGPEADGAVTLGIVSTKPMPGEGHLTGVQVIQADVFVAEGMAGGPLVNLKGEVVAMTTDVPRRPRQGRQLAAAIPINTVHDVVVALAKDGRVPRGWLGVMLQPMPPEALKALNIGHGVQIGRVIEGQPGAKAGLKDGDVVLEFGGAKVADMASLCALVAAAKPGAKVPVKLLRDGKEMALDVTLGEQEGEAGVAAAPGEGAGENLDFGISVQTLTPELANQFGFEGAKGVVVTAVDAKGLAAKARPAPIERGDLITEINRTPVASVADARKAVADARKAREKTLLILVRAKEGARYVVVDLAQ